MILLAVVGFFLFGLVTFLTFAWVTGTEVSPNNFQQRNFSYIRIPYTKVRLSATTITPRDAIAPDDVLKHLKTLNLETVWHVTQAKQYRSETFPAEILVRSLQQRNADSAYYWGAWSVDHPGAAAVFWPLVQQAAHRELYFVIPELLKSAEQFTEAEPLELEVFQSLSKAVQTRCQAWDATQNQKEIQALRQWFASLPIQAKSTEIREPIEQLQQSITPTSEGPTSINPKTGDGLEQPEKRSSGE